MAHAIHIAFMSRTERRSSPTRSDPGRVRALAASVAAAAGTLLGVNWADLRLTP